MKILKLFVRELTNIIEGKETGDGNGFAMRNGTGGTTGSVEDGESGWESDDDEEEWENVGGSQPGSSDGGDDVDSREDILKGINTEVSSVPALTLCGFCIFKLIIDNYYRVFEGRGG